MEKPTKIQYDDSDDDSCASDGCRSDDEEDYSKEELMDFVDQLNKGFNKKRKECKGLEQKLKALRKSFEELQASHECLKEDHEELVLAHTRLEKARSSLLELAKEKETKKEVVKEHVPTNDIGLTCDIIDESFYRPIVVAPTNPSCSSSSTTTNSTSTMSDGFTCDAALVVENESLKREVDELTHALGNAYGGDAHLLKCLGSQRFSLNKEGLGYTPKKGKAAFATPKPSFVKSNGRFYNRCK
jgi:regulator of replication initiation timing